jgi:hypothetical protein
MRILITGAAGFIGSNLVKAVYKRYDNPEVVGIDNMNDYYDVRLKEERLKELEQYPNFNLVRGNIADKALIMQEIDNEGLDKIDHRVLSTIIRYFNGGPVGLETLAATINEDSGTIEDVCEPYLLQRGFISRTPRGRVATPLAYQHLGIPLQTPNATPAESLWGEEV